HSARDLCRGLHNEVIHAHRRADFRSVRIEDGGDAEVAVLPAAVLRHGLADPPETTERDLPLRVDAQDRRDLLHEMADIVAFALLAELAEVREIAPDLRGGDPDTIRQIAGGDGRMPFIEEILQGAVVDREAADHN